MPRPNKKYKLGYCHQCVKNVSHFRAIQFRILRTLDALTLGITRWLRIGPWYCSHCLTKSLYLSWVQPGAHRITASEPRSKKTNSDAPLFENEIAQPVGNYLKSDQSLVMRSKRLMRFTEKYRDSMVRRLLSGSSSILQIRQEKDISEGELLDWVADLFDRMQAKLDVLEGSSSIATPQNLSQAQSSPAPHGSILRGSTVQGQVNPS